MSTDVLLYSGGIDSLIAWYYLAKPLGLYIHLNHTYGKKEIRAMEKLPVKYDIYRLNWNSFEKPNAHIPGRNLLLCLQAAAMGYETIYLVAQRGEQNIPDRSPKFFEQTSEVLSFHFQKDIKIVNPFPDKTKGQMVAWYLNEGLPPNNLFEAVSCYTGYDILRKYTSLQCSECPACFRKFVCLESNKINTHPHIDTRLMINWAYKNYIPRLHEYSEDRVVEIKTALEFASKRL